MNIKQLLATTILPNSTTARLDLEILLAWVLEKPRAFLYSYPETILTPAQQQHWAELIARRHAGEPLAYIVGHKEFWSLQLTVNNQVLIPRPETELLVELALAKITNSAAVIADLGTGSGAIAIALATERPNWQIYATDLSQSALAIAKLNAQKFCLNNITFCAGNWCAALPDLAFDAIISNPPYIAHNDPHLLAASLKFEPQSALVAGDGLRDLTTIITQAHAKLKPNGWLMLEHGHDQSPALQALLQQQQYRNIMPQPDLAQLNRVVIACK